MILEIVRIYFILITVELSKGTNEILNYIMFTAIFNTVKGGFMKKSFSYFMTWAFKEIHRRCVEMNVPHLLLTHCGANLTIHLLIFMYT